MAEPYFHPVTMDLYHLKGKLCRAARRCLLALCLLNGPADCLAQEPEPINTDRPDQSDGVYTVPTGVFQLEEGATIGEDLLQNNLMVRYGLASGTEARLLVDAGRAGMAKGLLPVAFSVKQRLLAGRGARPAVALVGYAGIGAWASGELREEGIATELKLAFESELSDRWALGWNIGTSDPLNNVGVTCGLGWSASAKAALFVEYFATFSQAMPRHNVDAGLLFAVLPELQVDIAGGRALVGAEQRLFATAGVAYRFSRRSGDPVAVPPGLP